MDDMDDSRYGSRGSSARYTSRKGYSTVDRFSDVARHNSMGRRDSGFNDRRSMERGRGVDRHQRTSQRPSFKDQIENLFRVIEDAMGFYDSFLQSFYRDVQFIKSYAGSEILDHLWRSKVGASHNRNGAKIRDRASHANDREMTMPEPGMGFQDIARDLCEHIHATLTIAGKQRQARDGENAAHVFTKLGKSVKGLTNDMERAPFRAKDTKNLMTELEMLLTFLSANGAGRSNQREMAGDQNLRMEQHYDEQEGPTDCEGEQEEY